MDIWLFPANNIYMLPVIVTLEQENWNLERILVNKPFLNDTFTVHLSKEYSANFVVRQMVVKKVDVTPII